MTVQSSTINSGYPDDWFKNYIPGTLLSGRAPIQEIKFDGAPVQEIKFDEFENLWKVNDGNGWKALGPSRLTAADIGAHLKKQYEYAIETKFDKAVRAAKASISDPRHGDTYSYDGMTIMFLDGGWTYPPAITNKEDPDGPLVPLSTKSVPNRVIAPVNHDFVAALYKPYVSPI